MESKSSQNEISPEDLKELLQDFAQSLSDEETANEKTRLETKAYTSEKHTRCSLQKYSFKIFRKMEDHPLKNYNFCEVIDVQKATREQLPSDSNVHILGVYTYEPGYHWLTSLNKCEPNVQNPAKVILDFTAVNHFPAVDTVVEIYGTLQLKGKVVVYVHFFHELGDDKNRAFEYMDLLKQKTKMFPP